MKVIRLAGSLHPLLSFSQSLPFSHSSFEHVQVCFQSTPHPITFSCVYRPPPSSTNKLTTRMFLSEFDQLLDHYSLLPGNLIVLGDINIHYDNPDSYDTKHICSSLSHHNMTQHISEPTQQAGHILDSNQVCLVNMQIQLQATLWFFPLA